MNGFRRQSAPLSHPVLNAFGAGVVGSSRKTKITKLGDELSKQLA
jgi:hypothetical protein